MEIPNSQKFHFTDFTRVNYRRLIKIAKENYTFRSYHNFDHNEHFVLWRHDIDFSVHAARQLAKIETEEGVTTTYFLHLHSAFYNLLEKEITECIRNISQGHHIGLHFDTYYYNEIQNESHLVECLLKEKYIVEDIFQTPVSVFSFHNTTPFTMSFNDWDYAGMINTYAKYFQDEVGYCSDSNGYWRFRRLEDVLTAAEDGRLQVLIHPEWWQDDVMSPRQRIHRCIDGRAEKNKIWYDKVLKDFGRKNVE